MTDYDVECDVCCLPITKDIVIVEEHSDGYLYQIEIHGLEGDNQCLLEYLKKHHNGAKYGVTYYSSLNDVVWKDKEMNVYSRKTNPK